MTPKRELLGAFLRPSRVWAATLVHQGPRGLAKSVWYSGRLAGVGRGHLPLRVHGDSRVELHGRAHIESLTGASLVLGYVDHLGAGLTPIESGAALLRLNDESVLRLTGPKNFFCGPGCTLALDKKAIVELGSNSYIAAGGKIVATDRITIGDDTSISWDVTILDSNLHTDDRVRRAPAPIVIGSRVWIGHGASILPGVTIGDDAIVAARACVTKDVEPGQVVAGVPAVPIRGGGR